MLGFLWDVHQQVRISGAEARAEEVAHQSADVRRMAEAIEARLDALTLATMAMWSMMREGLGVTDEQLADRIEAIDASDGRIDGKVSATVTACRTCGRKMSSRHRRCLFCGAEAPGSGPFRGV